MASVVQAAASPHAPEQEALSGRVAGHMRDPRAGPAAVYADIQRLEGSALRPHGLDACYMNLLALLGERWGAERVRAEAAQCARSRLWRGWQHSAEIGAAGARTVEGEAAPHPVLEGWDAGVFERLRSSGRGVMVCGFHFGSWRHVPTDLWRLGLPVTFAVDTRLADDGEALGEADGGRFAGRLRVAGIDEPGGLVGLVRAMRGGGVGYLNVDAHRGWGMGHGADSFCTVRFLGLTLRMMTGVARIAAANGAALLPVVAVPQGRAAGHVVVGAPILPPATGTDAEFVPRAMQALYDFFEPVFLAAPSEWQDVRFLHRWRVPEAARPSSAPPPACEDEVLRHLRAGGAFRVDERRCVWLGGGTRAALVDVRTMRGFHRPPDLPHLPAALEESPGVGEPWLRERCGGSAGRVAALSFLAELLKHGLLRASVPG